MGCRIPRSEANSASTVRRCSTPGLTLVGKQGWATAQWRNKQNHAASAILHTSGGAWTPQYRTHGKGLNYIGAISAGSTKHVYAFGQHYPDFDTSARGVTYTMHGHKWKATSQRP